jgi:tartrate dehydratase beta subunit/fumarate hydratase class I family protein
MNTVSELVSEAISDFRKVIALACAEFPSEGIKVEILAKPHEAPTLPIGQVAVYAFFLDGQALKVGMAGPTTAARYKYQHYNPKSASSNLAKSILSNPAIVGADFIDPQSVGDWIKKRTDRVNLLLPITTSLLILKLLESFLHVRWNPTFEGRSETD